MKKALAILAVLLTGCGNAKVQHEKDGSLRFLGGGSELVGDIAIIEKNGHTFAVFMNDHGGCAMVEIQPK